MEESEKTTGLDLDTSHVKVSDPIWYLSCAVITAIAVLVRFASLTMKPMHHDEGVNGWFLTNLFRDGQYKYDPANYHGPTLYYISLAFAKVFGLETVSVRASVAVWGVLIVVLIFFLRRYIGRIGSLVAALFLALSPGMVYISRYFIHEMFFVFLSLAIVLAVVFFIEKRRPGVLAIAWTALILIVCFLPSTLKLASTLGGESEMAVWAFRAGFFIVQAILVGLVIRMLLTWNDGRPIYLLLASASVSLMFATKETAFITLGTMLIACGCVWIWRRVFKVDQTDGATSDLEDGAIEDSHLTWNSFRSALGSGSDLILIVIASIAIFLFIAVLFFSSFFTNGDGVAAAVEAYTIWSKTGSKDHTQNGTWAYLKWGMELESPLILLSALGALIAFVKARHRFAMFAALWAFGLFAAYSIIPYKTPWLAISFLLPMGIAAGYAINEMIVARNASMKLTGGLLALIAIVVLSYQTYELNFVHYDDEDTAYVYAHTNRQIFELLNQIQFYADNSGKGKNAKIEIVSPDYWPLVWYLRDYKQANFHGRLIDTSDAEMIVAKVKDQDADVAKKYSARYAYISSYALRPGVDLMLLVRKDLAVDGRDLYQIPEFNK